MICVEYRQPTSQNKEKMINFKPTQVEYLPMGPLKNVDQKYVVMASLKDKILVSEPVPI